MVRIQAKVKHNNNVKKPATKYKKRLRQIANNQKNFRQQRKFTSMSNMQTKENELFEKINKTTYIAQNIFVESVEKAISSTRLHNCINKEALKALHQANETYLKKIIVDAYDCAALHCPQQAKHQIKTKDIQLACRINGEKLLQ